MGLSTWLKERRLERTHRKLKHLRAIQAKVRGRLEAVQAEKKKHGAPSTELDMREKKFHDEKEKLTRQIHTLQAEEEKLKAELKGSNAAAPG